MSDFVEQVATGLAKLRKKDRSLRVFGASTHRYTLNPPLSAALRKKERTLGLTLPDDYRRFLTELGDGGAGPYFGVFQLGFIDDNFGFQSWKKSHMVGDPKRAFPFRRAWKPRVDDEPADEFNAINGAIPLCHEGCALRDFAGANSGLLRASAPRPSLSRFGWSCRGRQRGRCGTMPLLTRRAGGR